MATREDLVGWFFEVLETLPQRRGSIVDPRKCVWRAYEAEIKDSNELFYTWQYDIRWAANRL